MKDSLIFVGEYIKERDCMSGHLNKASGLLYLILSLYLPLSELNYH